MPAGRAYLLEIKKESVRIQTPFDVDGVLDFGLQLDYYDWSSGRNIKYLGGDKSPKFDTLADFQQYMLGYDTNHPAMRGYWQHAVSRVHNAINRLMDPDMRRVKCSGIKNRILQKNATYTTADITGDDPPEGTRVIHVDGDDPDALTAEARSYMPRFSDFERG